MKKALFRWLVCLAFPGSLAAQTFPLLISVPPGTVKNALTHLDLSVPLSISNLGPVPLTVYMTTTVSAKPKEQQPILINVLETVIFTPSQLGGNPYTDMLNIYNSRAIGTGNIRIDLIPTNVVVRAAIFTYDKCGNRVKRNIGNVTINTSKIINILPHQRLADKQDTMPDGVTLYPNPTQSILRIKIEHAAVSDMVITLFDFMGHVVFEKKSTTEFNEVDFSPFAAGAYKLRLVYADQQKVYTVLKEN